MSPKACGVSKERLGSLARSSYRTLGLGWRLETIIVKRGMELQEQRR